MNMITDRQKEIDDLYTDAGKDRREAAELRNSYEEQIAQMRALLK